MASQLFHEVQVLHIACRPASNLWGVPRLSMVTEDDPAVPVTHAVIDMPPAFSHGIGDLVCAAFAVRAARRIHFHPDLIHCNVTLPSGLAAWWLKKTMHVPVVLTEHASDYQVFYGGTWQVRFKSRIALRSMDAIMPVAQGQEEIMRPFCSRGNYVVVPNAVDTSLFKINSHRGDRHHLQGLTICALKSYKGHEFLLRAYASLPEVVKRRLRLLIVGDGPLRASLLALRSELQIEENVQFKAGGRTKSEIARLMQQSDFLVHPSLREANPCVLIEAMACGKPVLAADCRGSADLLNPETGLVVERSNVESLANGLKEMVEGIHRYDSAKICRQAHAKYSYESVGKQFGEVYKSVLSRG